MYEFKVTLSNGRTVFVMANNPEHAVMVASAEFGMSASNPREPLPEITEYLADGCNVFAHYDDDSEHFVLQAESPEHAQQKAARLNAAL